MEKRQKISLLVINTTWIAALLVVVLPLLIIGYYNYPCADDWSFGHNSYHAIQEGKGLIGAFLGAFETVKENHFNWEGRFTIPFLGAFQPGIWGENYYSIVTWMMIGALISSELFLFYNVLCKKTEKTNKLYWLPVVIPSLIMQLLYCPSPEESFYWYNGSVSYTFVFCLSLLFYVIFVKIGMNTYVKWKYVCLIVVESVLAILIGGGNFATSLSSIIILSILSVLFFVHDKRIFAKTFGMIFLNGVSLLIALCAPGNSIRINNNFDGKTGNPIEAILMSLLRSFTNIYSWTDIKIILMLLLILPFVWKAVKGMKFSFKYPLVFTVLSFGIYASQIVATMYVDGTTGGGRMAAILYYSYHIWLLLNVIYWCGWLNRKENVFKRFFDEIWSRYVRCLLPYCAVIGVVLIGYIYVADLKTLSSYRAYRALRQGWAKQYATEWDARLKVLHDNSIKDVVFEHISVYPEVILYADLQDENGHLWVNNACASYYNKNSITVIKPSGND